MEARGVEEYKNSLIRVLDQLGNVFSYDEARAQTIKDIVYIIRNFD